MDLKERKRAYSKKARDKRTPEQRQAAKEYARQYHLNNKEKFNRYSRTRYQKNKAEHKIKSRRQELRKSFGITQEDYNRLFNAQEGCCAICSKHQREFQSALCVDHDHKTGEIRGLLCMKCNTSIGALGDNAAGLQKALDYIRGASPLRLIVNRKALG